ncbi:DUF4430 domain-containing protein [Companilactobacillus allii]|uniref:Transcobalamin-like C-terminal domain-containing protein n=1 Tax=Companilactobacillus allii TaxID=1847728 RepID=A0A1P8Q5V7_9LACO|nr:DUF4430 domain-containing protein [Companilactobacillus allii]APX73248.1 hypothetical protein BTM29_12130 [Companilactobacillus allii]USQ68061.1 DUF4430 domain-containing protein [Companilactobacillus allii]
MKKRLIAIVFALALLVGLAAPLTTANAATDKVSVTYTVKDGSKQVAKKTCKLSKNTTVLAGLKKAWTVKEKDSMITSIDNCKAGKNQKWTYKINGKKETKKASKVKVANNDKITFTLSKK